MCKFPMQGICLLGTLWNLDFEWDGDVVEKTVQGILSVSHLLSVTRFVCNKSCRNPFKNPNNFGTLLSLILSSHENTFQKKREWKSQQLHMFFMQCYIANTESVCARYMFQCFPIYWVIFTKALLLRYCRLMCMQYMLSHFKLLYISVLLHIHAVGSNGNGNWGFLVHTHSEIDACSNFVSCYVQTNSKTSLERSC